MTGRQEPQVSFVIATHDRRAVVLNSLERIAGLGLDPALHEIIVVDNNSSDGTAEAVDPHVSTLITLDHNAGSCAKAIGVGHAKGEYVVFLDDDSFPRPGSIERMIEHFRSDPSLGAAGFSVHLPDGSREGGALPGVFVGCGVGLRAAALWETGGLELSFFMQAEEYDLSFKLVSAGWRVEVFDDLHVDHLKTPTARISERTTYYDIRNNLRVAARYLPDEYHSIYRDDILQRYAWLAEHSGHVEAYSRGAKAGKACEDTERESFADLRLDGESFERFFRLGEVKKKMTGMAQGDVRRVVFADLGKNCYAFTAAAEAAAGIDVLAIADDRFAAPGRNYRGLDIMTVAEALALKPDAVVISNMGPVHAARTRTNLATMSTPPVYQWYGAVGNDQIQAASCPSAGLAADEYPKADASADPTRSARV